MGVGWTWKNGCALQKETHMKVAQQSPQFVQVILEWGACEQNPALAVNLLNMCTDIGNLVLDLVAFIKHDISSNTQGNGTGK